jgi:hypothetical protein
MTFHYEPANAAKLLALDDEGTAVASDPGTSALVGLKELSLPKLRALWEDFKVELRQALCDVLGKTPSEFAEWHVVNDRYDLSRRVINEWSCVGFKRITAEGPKLHYLRQPAVIEALLNLGLIPRTDAHGKPRRNMIRGEGGVPAFCQRLPLDQQRLVLGEVFASAAKSLDDILFISQTSIVSTQAVDELLATAPNAEASLTWLAGALWEFDAEQQTQSVGGKGAGRHFAAPWFCAYLGREGYVLLPRLLDSENFLPRLLTPFFWTFFVPAEARELARHMVQYPGEKHWMYTYAALRDLVLYTNFFQQASKSFTLAHALYLKREYTTSETRSSAPRVGAVQRSHGLNRLFKAYIDFHEKTWEDVGPDARFFGGGRKLAVDHGRVAFAWVDNPKSHKLALYRKLVGSPPEEFPEFIRNWARDLRSLLPLFAVQTPQGKIDTLNYWLIYLIKLGDGAPKSWHEVDRETHINHAGLGTHLTFVEFLRSVDRSNRQKIISDLQKAWYLAAQRDGFASKLTCPIDFKIDFVGWGEGDVSSGRTRRKSVPEEVYEILVEENRRDEFAFARNLVISSGPRQGQKTHWRTVTDPDTGERVEVFWPGLPIILDMILSTGMRQSSAIWMDSGEGDEHWVDRESLRIYPNPLPSRTKGRSAGFLRVCQIGDKEADKVLGMYLAVNKTGPYQVPWVDPTTAKFFIEMRSWQARWNARRMPVKATRSDMQVQYAGEGKIPEVYPLFWDPESRSSYPPTAGTLYAYWAALLRHCEAIVAKKLGYDEPLLLNGKPRWDLHSLRVTTVSTLLQNGVEPWVVAELVGHASVVMTWHYKDVDPRKTHAALQQAHERRRRQVVEDLQNLAQEEFAGTEEEFEAKIQDVLGGLVKLREDNVGGTLFRASVTEGGGHEIFSHGICPGGDCRTGGHLHKNAYQSVFRPRACSRCRFRLTGPAFLAGLVHRMNCLMVEIKASIEKEARLNLQIDAAEDQGKGDSGQVRILRGLVARERELRDDLYSEWCAEMATIRTAEGLLDKAGAGGALPVVTGLDADGIRAQLETVHQLALLHTVLADGNVLLGASLEVPDGLWERRDALLLELARNNDMSAFFYKLAPDRRRQALDQFADLLLDHVRDAGDIQRFLDGEMSVAEIPALQSEVESFLASNESDAVAAAVGGQLIPKAMIAGEA